MTSAFDFNMRTYEYKKEGVGHEDHHHRRRGRRSHGGGASSPQRRAGRDRPRRARAYISFANCGLPYHISGAIAERDKLLVTSEAMFEARYNVDVRSRTEALSIDRANKTVTLRNLDSGEETVESYDRLLLSPGAEVLKPPIPGMARRAFHAAQHPRSRSHHGLARRNKPRRRW
jgi:Uncharacterized NAD(FAD)-dependent dehydrogenases